MYKKYSRFHIGLRTLKTAVAVVLAMIVVDTYGATASKLIFAMLGAMAVVQPTFRESLESCCTQIIGVLFGSAAGVFLLSLPIPRLMATGIGIILVITLYNVLSIRFSPSLPCFIVVMLCTTPDIQPMAYALGRIWDTAIGLGIGMAVNTLVFPYDNSRKIRAIMESLDRDLLTFLEEMFDGDEVLPDAEVMVRKVDTLSAQLQIFSRQLPLVHPRRRRRKLAYFQSYEGKARQLTVHMEALCQLGQPGRLDGENRKQLTACGAVIRDRRVLDAAAEKDIITNYHLRQILHLRQELLQMLQR